jgi:hypothetical protein
MTYHLHDIEDYEYDRLPNGNGDGDESEGFGEGEGFGDEEQWGIDIANLYREGNGLGGSPWESDGEGYGYGATDASYEHKYGYQGV